MEKRFSGYAYLLMTLITFFKNSMIFAHNYVVISISIIELTIPLLLFLFTVVTAWLIKSKWPYRLWLLYAAFVIYSQLTDGRI